MSGFVLGHRPALDGIRGIAILAVLFGHSGWLRGGWLGVDVFFTLSGFLITCLLLQEHERRGAIRLGHFYARRALRLLPAVLLVVAAHNLLLASQQGAPPGLGLTVVAVLLYVANWAAIAEQPMFYLGHTWSLAIEEQFYLLWAPLVAWVLARRASVGVAGMLLLGAGGVAGMRWALGDRLVMFRLYAGSDLHADPLLVGCALGVLVTVRGLGAWWGRLAWPALVWLGLLLVTSGFPDAYLAHGAALWCAVATALVIAGALGSRVVAAVLAVPPLVYLGRISYGLYLWHYPVFATLGGLSAGGDAPSAGTVLLTWAVTFGLAVPCFHLIERPFLAFKDRAFGVAAEALPELARAGRAS